MCCLLLNMCFRSGKLKTDLRLTESEDDVPYQKSVPSTTETKEYKQPCDNDNILIQAIPVEKISRDTKHVEIEINQNRITNTMENQVADTEGVKEIFIDCDNGVTQKTGNLYDNAIAINDYIVVDYVHPVPEVTVILDKDAESAMILIEKNIFQAGGSQNEINIESIIKTGVEDANPVVKSIKSQDIFNHNEQIISRENVIFDNKMKNSEKTEKDIMIHTNKSFEVELVNLNLDVKYSNFKSITSPSPGVSNAEKETFSKECHHPENITISYKILKEEQVNLVPNILPISDNEVSEAFDEYNVDTTFKGDEIVEEFLLEAFYDRRNKIANDVMGNKLDTIGVSSCGDSDSNTNGS